MIPKCNRQYMTQQVSRASAPAKVHLIGEHSVVYGEPAILTALGWRTYVESTPSKDVSLFDQRFDSEPVRWPLKATKEWAEQVFQEWQICADRKNFKSLFEKLKPNGFSGYRQAMLGFFLNVGDINDGVSVTIRSDIKPGSGVGSSASMSLAVAQSLGSLFGKNWSKSEINQHAYRTECWVHGLPSGGDNSACCWGGLIWFERKAHCRNKK